MDSPLTILHVVVNMNRGGAETMIMNMYRNIDRKKVQFDFLTFKPGVFDQEIEQLGGIVHRIPYISEVGYFRFTKELNRFMDKNNDYQIIHSHMDKMSGLILKSAKRANIPIRISHSHNTKSEGRIFSQLFKWYAGTHLLTSSTHFYACSEVAAQWLFKHKAKRAQIVNNGIDMKKFLFSRSIRNVKRKELLLEKDTIVLGHVGRFLEQKNHLFLINMLSSLKKSVPTIKLLLVGDGPLRKTIEKNVQNLKLENHVKFLGIRSDIHELLQAFDLFLMPSHHEGLPLTLIEAQSASLPCLISNKITNEVDMGMGLAHFLPITNPYDWTEKVEQLLSNSELEREIVKNDDPNHPFDITKTVIKAEKSYLSLGNDAV